MPTWYSARWKCKECDQIWDEIVDSKFKDHPLDCACGGTAVRIPFANITKATYVDGSNRFSSVKKRRSLEREVRRNIDKGDLGSAAAAKTELNTRGDL